MPSADMVLYLKYAWQQSLLEAFTEFSPELLPAKIAHAQRLIAARLSDSTLEDIDERIALSDAIRSLRTLGTSS